MDSSYINENASINTSISCIHDSSIGYQADFSVNGEVDGWTFFDGIHTYGCWGGFLFGTIYDSYGTVGRPNVFLPVDASTHYFIRIIMKYNPAERDTRGIHPLPTQGKIRWVTLASPIYDSDKELKFTMYPDNKWHTYIINVGVAQYWQGDVNNLRVWPAIDYAEDGDEFFIRAIEIFSIDSNHCNNTACDKYLEYSHPCPWTGKRASIESAKHDSDALFTIADQSELLLNINDYGNEIIKLEELNNAPGSEVANLLAKTISKTDIGGYAEVAVEYTDENTFKIYTGTITADSTIEIVNNDLARQLKFFNILNQESSTITAGEDPASGYSPLSSFKIKTYQLYNLLDGNKNTSLTFNPFSYSIEGGRRDWNASALGLLSVSVGTVETDQAQLTNREYYIIRNTNKTIIDFNHPFNASGRITKIWVQCTLDDSYQNSQSESQRKAQELSGGKVLIVRPKRDGTMSVVHQWDINDRDPSRSWGDELFSRTQESITFDVDVFVNKGDMLAVYNAHMLTGKTVSGNEYDARFYQVDGLVSENFDPGKLYGDGSSGLLLYARGEETQRRLFIEMDLKNRYNIDNIDLKAAAQSSILEYNIARCLDINWECDLFGEDHFTEHYKYSIDPGPYIYRRDNVYYGLENLNDGIYVVPDGKACDSFSVTYNNSTFLYNDNAGPGVIPVDPHYFWVNGDEEWLAIWLHIGSTLYAQSTYDFVEDPIAFTIKFPLQKTKKIYKSKIYFKEKVNFKTFAISTYGGPYYTSGDADDYHYNLVPEYTKVILDGKEYYEDGPGYDSVDKYLFVNPSIGHAISAQEGPTVYEWDPVLSEVVADFGNGETGFFTSARGKIVNYDEFEQARNLAWNILEHQWEPIECYGFRFYCNYHQSTKLTEFELYGSAEDVGSSLAGSIEVTHSDYGDIWWPAETSQLDEENVNIYIGDSPRYLRFEIIPVTETIYYDMIVSVKTGDSYVGNKGCDYINLIEHSKAGITNNSQVINLKNVYGHPYDLYVDIKKDTLFEDGVTYFSKLNNALSISNPDIGPDGIYYKLPEYRILNQDYNVAINCDVYGLKNLIDGATAYYSYDDMYKWTEFGTLSNETSIDFYSKDITRSLLNIPTLSRSRYWKLGFLCPGQTANVVEMRIYDDSNNRLYPEFYHDLNQSFTDGPAEYRAPHLGNDSITGSYYTLTDDQYITMDFGDNSHILSRIELYHNNILDYSVVTTGEGNDSIIGGIDRYTKLCIRPWADMSGYHINDVSYYEMPVSLVGFAEVIGGNDTTKNYSITTSGIGFAGWDQETLYSSEFYPSTSGNGYVDFYLEVSNSSQDAIFKSFSTVGDMPFWQQTEFELEFEFNLDSWENLADSSTYDYPIICIGVLGFKSAPTYTYTCYRSFWEGVQIWFSPEDNRMGLAVRETIDKRTAVTNQDIGSTTSNRTYTYAAGFNTGTTYYCRLTSAGSDSVYELQDNITYNAKIWTDGLGGSNLVADLTINSNYRWDGYHVGIVSGGPNYSDNGVVNDCTNSPINTSTFVGRVSNINFTASYTPKNYPWIDDNISIYEKASIRIPTGSSNYVSISNDNSVEMDIGQRRHTFDLWCKFNSLPATGERWSIAQNWGVALEDQAWRLCIYNTGNSNYRLKYRIELWIDGNIEEYLQKTSSNVDCGCDTFSIDRWYYLTFSSGKNNEEQGYGSGAFVDINGRSYYDDYYVSNPAVKPDIPKGPGIELGPGDFNGCIAEFRLSIGSVNTINTSNETNNGAGNRIIAATGGSITRDGDGNIPVPLKPYDRYYPISLYISNDNVYYGLYANVDLKFGPTEITYLPELYYDYNNKYSNRFNTYFAIDLGHRFDTDLTRRYGADDDLYIDKNTYVMWSNIDSDDPNDAFNTEITFNPDETFAGFANEPVDKEKWYISDSLVSHEAAYLGTKNERLEHKVDSALPDGEFYTTYGIRGDFNVEIKCGRISAPNTNTWAASFKAEMSNGASGSTYFDARFEYSGSVYKVRSRHIDNGSTISDVSINLSASDDNIGLKIIRDNITFKALYYKNGTWRELNVGDISDSVGKDVIRLSFGLVCSDGYPTTKIYWKNFKFNSYDSLVYRSTYQDARWMAVEILNATSRYIKKIGIYPDITKTLAPDISYHNSEWNNLGPSVTNYTTPVNLALGATVSGSSQISPYVIENITDGIISDDRFYCWLSDNSSEHWVLIDLGAEEEIYRVKIYHGFDTENYPDYYAKNYRIETSLDNQSFTTIFNITNNSSLSRTHDLADPVITRYIRIYITSFNLGAIPFRIQDPDSLAFINFEGVAFREIEVYKYSGYGTISSEEYPIIALNLKDQFYIKDHELIGLYAESTSYDWNNSASAFAWSDSVSSNPQHVKFTSFGTAPDYEQWVAIKRDTATYHNPDPDPSPDPIPGLGVDYLKYVRIQSELKENPIYYPWWWNSNISTLTRDYDKDVILSTASLKIEYPTSSAFDTISFIEGSSWGMDSNMAYRDGLSFRWYIEDINKLDLETGYFYFGGTDGTESGHDVIYYWNFSTYSGSLVSGWNTPFLRFKNADNIEYYDTINYEDLIHPLSTEHTTWHTAGMGFRGKGQSFIMNIDGFVIKRNHFNDANKFDYGLYLAGADYLTAPISAIDFNAGAIEFWLRPDYNGAGGDFLRRYYSRGLFALGNVANDVFGCLINNKGFVVYFGNVTGSLNTLEIGNLNFIERDGLYHVAVVFSNTGENISSDSSTVKVLINNVVIGTGYTTWRVDDNKLLKFVLGGKPPLGVVESLGNLKVGSIDGVISNLRMYNYCKLDYTDSLSANWTGTSADKLLQSSEMIEISSDNVTFYKVDEEGLPFYFPLVPTGITIPIYVRSIVPKGLTGNEKRTSGLVTMWDIGI